MCKPDLWVLWYRFSNAGFWLIHLALKATATSSVIEQPDIMSLHFISSKYCKIANFSVLLISGPSESALAESLLSLVDAILSMVNIAANMLGAKTEESSETEGTAV